MRRYSPATRNIPASLAGEIGAAGGLVGIVMSTQLLGGSNLADAVATIRRALESAGVDHVAIGSDMDGALKMVIDVEGLPALADALLRAELAPNLVEGVMGGNADQARRDPRYRCSRNTGAAEANAAANWMARTRMALRGSRGTQLMAKNATIGSWPSISSCQRWAAAPSSPSLDTPKPKTSARNQDRQRDERHRDRDQGRWASCHVTKSHHIT